MPYDEEDGIFEEDSENDGNETINTETAGDWEIVRIRSTGKEIDATVERRAVAFLFTKEDFTGGKYTIPLDLHNKGYNAVIRSIELQDDGYENAVCDYKRLLTGDIQIISNTAFNGKIIIEES